MIEIEESKNCPNCHGSGYGSWRNEEDYTLCTICNGKGKRKEPA